MAPYDLAALAGSAAGHEPDREGIERAFDHISQLENVLQSRLLEYLGSKPEVRVIGPSRPSRDRVATISFVHRAKRSADIAKAANAANYGIRYGHFYAYRLCDRLAREGVLHDVKDGVVRVSMLHYNTLDEIDGLIRLFEEVL